MGMRSPTWLSVAVLTKYKRRIQNLKPVPPVLLTLPALLRCYPVEHSAIGPHEVSVLKASIRSAGTSTVAVLGSVALQGLLACNAIESLKLLPLHATPFENFLFCKLGETLATWHTLHSRRYASRINTSHQSLCVEGFQMYCAPGELTFSSCKRCH